MQHLVGEYLQLEALSQALQTQQVDSIMTPKRFMHHINRLCKSLPQRIVLPEGMEPRVLRAAAGVARKGLAKLVLLGEPDAVSAEARRLSLDISQVESPLILDMQAPIRASPQTGFCQKHHRGLKSC